MKLNVFRIPTSLSGPLGQHLAKNGLSKTADLEMQGWKGEFLFSEDPNPSSIPWVRTFRNYIGNDAFYNRSYFGVMTLSKDDWHYAIAFGKAHFYVRPYCDYDFGIEVAKRIADDLDISQTAARRYQGKQTKSILSFAGQARLTVPPGNSVDFIQGRIIEEKSDVFGESAKFGTSCLLAPDIEHDQIGSFLSALTEELDHSPRFSLPRTLVLTDAAEIARYDDKLIDELLSPVGTSEITTSTFDLFGVDFVFSSTGSFSLKCGHYKAFELDRLTMKEVKEYLSERDIPRSKVLGLKVIHHREGDPSFVQPIKEAVDFICDEDLVVLRGGKWLKFNEDYLKALNDAVRAIDVEATEEELLETFLEEGEFNSELSKYGYEVADKNFEILRTNGATVTEAWDLSKDDTVYAVKFGTPQKLNYVVDQAMSVLEIIRNGASEHRPPPFKRYCLWLGYRAKKVPSSLADSGSIILKQKVEAWSRLCLEVGYTPVIKLSRKMHSVHDVPDESGDVGA